MNSLKIAVLLGGTSAERDVSLVTGIEIAKALRNMGHRVYPIDCAFGVKILQDLEKPSGEIIRPTPSDLEARQKELDPNLLDTVRFIREEKIDVAFVALHGGYGENGRLQALLDIAGIPYTGSGSLASALGMNKHLSKLLFRNAGVPTAPWKIYFREEEALEAQQREMNVPVVVKPNDQGSTVGLTILHEWKNYETAVGLAFRHSDSVLIESFIPGREITVAILDDQALPIVEIIPEHGIYDYECKYQSGKSKYKVPADLEEELSESIQALALKAYRALNCRHYARVDFRLNPEHQPFCLEVNTLPGMTPTSLVPKAAATCGIGFRELVERITGMALQ